MAPLPFIQSPFIHSPKRIAGKIIIKMKFNINFNKTSPVFCSFLAGVHILLYNAEQKTIKVR